MEQIMALSSQEIELVKLIVNGVSAELKAEISGMSRLFDSRDRNMCEKIEKMERTHETNHKQHDKRIVAIEKSLAYYIGKAAGVALVVSILGSILMVVLQILVKQ